MSWINDITKIPNNTLVMGNNDLKGDYIVRIEKGSVLQDGDLHINVQYNCTSFVKVDNAKDSVVRFLNGKQSNLPKLWRALTTDELVEYAEHRYYTREVFTANIINL